MLVQNLAVHEQVVIETSVKILIPIMAGKTQMSFSPKFTELQEFRFSSSYGVNASPFHFQNYGLFPIFEFYVTLF